MSDTQQKPAYEIEVLPLSNHEWRISDPARAESDGLALVGFIERVGDFYEVTQLGNPLDRMHFSSFDKAVSFLRWPQG